MNPEHDRSCSHGSRWVWVLSSWTQVVSSSECDCAAPPAPESFGKLMAPWRERAGRGPWDGEPDKERAWLDDKTGLPCAAIRNDFGAWCGYVGVFQGHPLFGMEMTDARAEKLEQLEVHGGVTWSRMADPETPFGEPFRRCWFIGFDCAHAGDLMPALRARHESEGAKYRTLGFVELEIAKLARQLAEVTS